MAGVAYRGRTIEPRVRMLADGGWSIEAWIYTEAPGGLNVRQFFTDSTAASKEEAKERAVALGRRAIDEGALP